MVRVQDNVLEAHWADGSLGSKRQAGYDWMLRKFFTLTLYFLFGILAWLK